MLAYAAGPVFRWCFICDMTVDLAKLPLTPQQSPVLDAVSRLLLAVFFAYCAGIYGQNAYEQWQETLVTGYNIAFFSHALAIVAVALYTLMLAFVYILRVRPVNKFAGWWPCIAALLGGFMGMGLVLFPRTNLPLPLQIFASIVILIGNGMAAYVLSQLGRSFSILAEGRRLVTTGPYKIVRHPLYAVEAIATIGVLMTFWSVGAFLLVIAQFAFQLVRMHYEEKVLRATFPEYADYASHTARLIPGVY
jgi:protein-S-isoprenylcysteine O-methyltransferase Ste14